MRSNRDDGDVSPGGTVVPEHAIGSGSCLLGVSLKDFFSSQSFQAVIFVGLKSGMSGICLQETKGLADGLEPFGQTPVFFKFFEVMAGYISE